MRREPSRERGRHTIEAVLSAAAREMEQGGLDRLTTKRIAAAAGLSVGTLYEYFPNKESIVVALITTWMDSVFDALASEGPAGRRQNLLSLMDMLLDRAIALYQSQPRLGAVLDMLVATPALHEIQKRHDERVRRALGAALARHLVKADPAEIDAAACAILMIGHRILSTAIVYRMGDRERMLDNLRVCVMAILSRLALLR